MSNAPSQAAMERETSYEKSTWPGVSIKLEDVFFAVFHIIHLDGVAFNG